MDRDISASIVTAHELNNPGSIPGRNRDYSFPLHFQIGSGVQSVPYSNGTKGIKWPQQTSNKGMGLPNYEIILNNMITLLKKLCNKS
jgi:hypothetical protein